MTTYPRAYPQAFDALPDARTHVVFFRGPVLASRRENGGVPASFLRGPFLRPTTYEIRHLTREHATRARRSRVQVSQDASTQERRYSSKYLRACVRLDPVRLHSRSTVQSQPRSEPRRRLHVRALRALVLAWWFFYLIPGGSGGIAGPYETETSCETIRKAFAAFFLVPVTSPKCTPDRPDR